MSLTVNEVGHVLLTQPDASSNPFPSVAIEDSDPNATASATLFISSEAHPGNELATAPWGYLSGAGVQGNGAGGRVDFVIGAVTPEQLSQILSGMEYNASGSLSGGIGILAQISDSDGASASLKASVSQGTAGTVNITDPGTNGSPITIGSTSHPLSGMTVTDGDVGAGVVLTAVITARQSSASELGNEIAAGEVRDTITANSQAGLTSKLDSFSYTVPDNTTEPYTEFDVSVSDNAVGSSGQTFVVFNRNVAPVTRLGITSPTISGTHWTDPLSSAARMQFLSQPGSGGSQDALVDPAYYLTSNPDVAASGMNATQHYETYGWHEGRNPDALFNTAYYLAQNPDVAASGMDPMLHYEDFGWKEGRNPSASFSTDKYLAANPDVAAAGMDPLVHFEQYGSHEGRLIWHV